MKKTIGILAHVDAGKTTFCEQLLYNAKTIRRKGRVDSKDTFLDNHIIEKQRGITIFSEQGIFDYNNSTYYLVDTPGHIDFSPDMERAIAIMDYGVVIISGVEKIQSHTKTVFRLLQKHKVPTFIFVNKIDRTGFDIEETIKQIKINLTENIVDISENLKITEESKLDEKLIEFIAERNEELFEKYLEDDYDEELWIDTMKQLIKNCDIYPLMYGSALLDIGIGNFLEKLDFLTNTKYTHKEEFIGLVHKIKHDENNKRLTYIKAIQGSLRVKDEVSYKVEDIIKTEKINEIRIYNSNKYNTSNEIEGGSIFAICGLTNAKIGTYIMKDYNEEKTRELPQNNEIEMIPTLKSKVIFDEKLNIKEVIQNLKILNEEEPALNVVYDEVLKEINIQVMGKIQLEILKEVIKDRFNMEVEFGPCEILYKETIKNATIGYGHFEPLGHYAEVHLKIEPTDRNSKIKFGNKAHVDELSIGHQNLVKTHIFEKEHKGILGGYPLTDLKITLLTGRAHNKHTSGGDFREATLRALRQGLEQTENILLEPYYSFKIEISTDYIGRVMSDIQKLNGEFDPPIINEEISIINGRGPVATFMEYPLEIISFSKGTGNISFVFDGYDKCHNSSEVLEKKDYDKNSDIEYTSNSIFCSKGQAYIVKGEEAKNHMHCIK